MHKLVTERSKKTGMPPGSLVHIGENRSNETKITLIEYSENNIFEKEITSVEELKARSGDGFCRWINIDGIHRVEILESVGKVFNLHPLVMEDILNTGQRPKLEDYGDYLYIVVKMLYYNSSDSEFTIEQESFVIGKDYVISIGEKDGDIFEPIREQLRKGIGRIRKMGADYFLYSLLDVVVDNYFVVLEKLGDKIERTEDALVIKPLPNTLRAIHRLKRQMLFLHKAVWPLREVVSSLERMHSNLIEASTAIYLRDLYDHVIQVMDTTETLRDLIASMLDIYLSSVSNKMNEVMKVLTIISTIFIPLTFIVGLYGMNMYIPEARWKGMYPLIWILMIGIAATMLVFFKKKRWW